MPTGDMNEDPNERFELKERFVWKWHPHGWLTALLILVIILLFRAFAR